LINYVAGGRVGGAYQPMNINYGLFPASSMKARNKQLRNELIMQKALLSMDQWMSANFSQ
jgi:folate-dependent tRNA-U54 methylase TrmFO/GidA